MEDKLPITIFQKSLNKLKNIFIWNRALSNLGDTDKIKNHKEFLKEELIEVKGPFVEYVASPRRMKTEFREFCESLSVKDSVIQSYETVLFKKKGNNYLYHHQGSFIESVYMEEDVDFTLAVPTASGKTEAFLLPILDACAKSNSRDLKAILFYPTKTLAVDQLNRIIKYVYVLNQVSKKNAISIGIWDGDTSYEVGHRDDDDDRRVLKSESLIRGIRCPECNAKLRIIYGEKIVCPDADCSFETMWIKATRKAIMTGVDILLTNPEAYDFLFIDSLKKKARIIGEKSFNENVKYVVFDEAHYWTGASGSAIHMLCERLRHFYSKELKIFVVSATIVDPKKFGAKLTGRKNVTIEFESEKYNYDKTQVNIYKIPPIFPEIAFQTLYNCLTNNSIEFKLDEQTEDYDSIIKFLSMLHYIDTRNNNALLLDEKIKNAKYADFGDFISSFTFVNDLKQRVIKYLPEILLLRDFLSLKDSKPINFTHFYEIIEKFVSKLDTDELLSSEEHMIIAVSLLTIGRLADFLQDRLHYFIRGNDGINFCETCNLITSNKICNKCGKSPTIKLYFCSTCHNIFYAKVDVLVEELDGQTQTKYDLETDEEIANRCPKCKSTINRTYSLKDGSVFHPQLLTQFLSSYGRKSLSKKILVFADSRNLAEKIGSDFTENDYKIAAQKYMLNYVTEAKTASDLYLKTLKFIDTQYYNPVISSLKDRASRENWKAYRDTRLRHFASLQSAAMVLNGGLITPTCILDNSSNDIQAIIGHTIFKKLSISGNFTKMGVRFEGYTLEKLLNFGLIIPHRKLIENISYVIKNLHDNNYIRFVKKDIITNTLRDKLDDEKVEEAIDYFEKQTRDLNDLLLGIDFSIPSDCYGLFDLRFRVVGRTKSRTKEYKIS
ncbi:MAG: DEAD/DEAH box helicase, partial [Candidatus Heimdallarchaeaceae archaeon]